MTVAVTRSRRRSGSSRRGFLVPGILVGLPLLVAVFGPLFAPHDPDQTIGPPGLGPVSGAPLGLDQLGRDVLSRVLYGGRSTLLLGVCAVVLVYAAALLVGLAAAYTESILDSILMRAVDVLLSFPALLLMLLCVTAFGSSGQVLVGAVAVVLFPGATRIIRTAAKTVMVRGYVEAAIARGERAPAVLGREVLPNIVSSVAADVGVRFGWAVILIASVNYLGLGLKPPQSDWGLMVSENRSILSSNPVAVLAPAAFIALLVVGVNMLGDVLSRRLGGRANA
jgi:peptide/nickel transport system permease protein